MNRTISISAKPPSAIQSNVGTFTIDPYLLIRRLYIAFAKRRAEEALIGKSDVQRAFSSWALIGEFIPTLFQEPRPCGLAEKVLDVIECNPNSHLRLPNSPSPTWGYSARAYREPRPCGLAEKVLDVVEYDLPMI